MSENPPVDHLVTSLAQAIVDLHTSGSAVGAQLRRIERTTVLLERSYLSGVLSPTRPLWPDPVVASSKASTPLRSESAGLAIADMAADVDGLLSGPVRQSQEQLLRIATSYVRRAYRRGYSDRSPQSAAAAV
jgi:hypothetical protein